MILGLLSPDQSPHDLVDGDCLKAAQLAEIADDARTQRSQAAV